MRNYKIIGLSGIRGSGKSFLAKSLVKEINNLSIKVKKDSFAKPLYQISSILLGEEIDKNKEYKIGSKSFTGREFLQLFGTEIAREFDSDIWIGLLLKRNSNFDGIIVVDDVRFPNEREIIDFSIFIKNEEMESIEEKHLSESHLKYLKNKANLILERKNDYYIINNIKSGFKTSEITKMIIENFSYNKLTGVTYNI